MGDERRRAVHLGLAGAEQVQVRAVEEQDDAAHARERYRSRVIE